MNLSSAPSKIVLPFANSGTKNPIPVASQIGITDGAASLTDGFPPLTLTPKAAGGVPPFGQDMNGILYAVSAVVRWANAGAGYVYDSAFATNANVSGYPKGARILRTDGEGYWINTVDGNTTDPEAGGAGWYPDFTVGAAAVTMTSSNVTLTALQYGKQVIIISGTLTANVQLIFPAMVAKWTVINNTTGNYTITCKTSAGTGVTVSGVQDIVGDGTNIKSFAASNFANSLATNGYQKLPSGLIIQWGIAGIVGDDSQITTTFPIAFPTSCFVVLATSGASSMGRSSFAEIHTISWNKTSVVFENLGNDGISTYPRWIAVGC